MDQICCKCKRKKRYVQIYPKYFPFYLSFALILSCFLILKVTNAGYVQNNNKKLKKINYISLHFLLILICVLMKKFLVGNFVW